MEFDFSRLATTRHQGDVGVMMALLYFTKEGHCSSVPISEGCRYDLLVEIDGLIQRVQVKTSGQRARASDGWDVRLATCGGNKSGQGKRKCLDASEFDLLFILTEDGQTWLIPSSEVDGNGMIVVGGPKWDAYSVQ